MGDSAGGSGGGGGGPVKRARAELDEGADHSAALSHHVDSLLALLHQRQDTPEAKEAMSNLMKGVC